MDEVAVAFGRFADSFSEPLLLVTGGGVVLAANGAAREIPIQAGRFQLGQRLQDFLEDDPGKVRDYLRACSRSLEGLPGTLAIRSAGAGPQHYRCLGSAVRGRGADGSALVLLRLTPKDAHVSRFAWLNDQIDQLKTEVGRRLHAEREADRQRQLWHVTLSSIGDAVIATDTAGRVTFVNAVAMAHLGCAESECIGRPLTDVFDIRNEETGAPVENPVQVVLSSGRGVALANHTVLVRPDGTNLPIDDSAAPIRDEAGNLFGVVLVFHEVSERRRLLQELTRQSRGLREADRRKDEFLAVLAHELRNPLAPLRNGLGILRLELEGAQTSSRALDMMERQVVHLIRLVNDLMDLNRVTHGIIDLAMAPLHLRDVISRSIESVGVDLGARGHRLEVRMPDEDLIVVGDADRLTQVFSNLLTNSIKYSDDGSLITIDLCSAEGQAVVHVTDTGVGIPADQLERVFEMFAQVREHHPRASGGLGIGLSVAKTLVENHGGSIGVVSDGAGRGSTFTVRLPLSVAKERPSVVPAMLTSRGRSLRILVADDNGDSADSLTMVLQLAGHDVRNVRNGREAVEVAATFAPQLVFMDIGMPEMDGLEATRAIRRGPQGADVLIVALTGWGQTRDRERTRAAGVDRHVVKPISPEELDHVLALAASQLDALVR
jgi:PAS domain S-box-containing protein